MRKKKSEKKENEKPVVTLQEMAVTPPPVVQIPKLPPTQTLKLPANLMEAANLELTAILVHTLSLSLSVKHAHTRAHAFE